MFPATPGPLAAVRPKIDWILGTSREKMKA